MQMQWDTYHVHARLIHPISPDEKLTPTAVCFTSEALPQMSCALVEQPAAAALEISCLLSCLIRVFGVNTTNGA